MAPSLVYHGLIRALLSLALETPKHDPLIKWPTWGHVTVWKICISIFMRFIANKLGRLLTLGRILLITQTLSKIMWSKIPFLDNFDTHFTLLSNVAHKMFLIGFLCIIKLESFLISKNTTKRVVLKLIITAPLSFYKSLTYKSLDFYNDLAKLHQPTPVTSIPYN